MDGPVQRLYELICSPIVTPWNLVYNAKLPNYDYVKFEKGPCGLVVSMSCDIEPGEKAIFFYHFDHGDDLQTVEMASPSHSRTIIFDRVLEARRLAQDISAMRRVRYPETAVR